MQLSTQRLILKPLDTTYTIEAHKFLGDITNTLLTKYFPTESVDETYSFLFKCQIEWKKSQRSFYEFAVTLNDFEKSKYALKTNNDNLQKNTTQPSNKQNGMQDKIIGKVSLYLNDDVSQGNIGWIFDKDFWGKGYALEAASAVKDFAFDVLKLKSIIARCDYRNVSSIKLVQKLGLKFSCEGTRKNRSAIEESKEITFFASNEKAILSQN